MPRPRKCRFIEHEPNAMVFKPRGIPSTMLENVNITFEELEAIRLKDLEGLDQAKAAVLMGVSRATFQRTLSSARLKISDALVNGKAIDIEGGNYSLAGSLLKCTGCGHEWRSQDGGICPLCACPDATQFTPGRRGCADSPCKHRKEKH